MAIQPCFENHLKTEQSRRHDCCAPGRPSRSNTRRTRSMKKTFDLLPDAVRPSLPWPRCKLRSIELPSGVHIPIRRDGRGRGRSCCWRQPCKAGEQCPQASHIRRVNCPRPAKICPQCSAAARCLLRLLHSERVLLDAVRLEQEPAERSDRHVQLQRHEPAMHRWRANCSGLSRFLGARGRRAPALARRRECGAHFRRKLHTVTTT